ncbi:hypothetical protein V5O48_001704 [Marasmius crinis-equi]|uniref:Protein kinase domain-containing protein n=1 Tax=Marasmius crinis-equi TaxID=585013 RepID=A0ABR3FY69_9AGAR
MSSIQPYFDATRLRTRNINRTSRFFQQLVAPPKSSASSLHDLLRNNRDSQIRSRLMDLMQKAREDAERKDLASGGIPTEHDAGTGATSIFSGSTSSTPSDPESASPTTVHSQVLYAPPEHYKWILDHPIVDVDQVFLSDGAMCSAFLKTSRVGEKQMKYISKCWHVINEWRGSFFSELALYKKHMKELQGDVVPTIIAVLAAPAALNVAMEPPHHSFWIEASTDMPLVLKDRCVEAFEKIHARGVLHGDVELRHMLIGGDGKVTVIDFQESRALVPIPDLHLKATTFEEMRMEMRKVKVKLDYPGARDWEQGKLQRWQRRQHPGFQIPFTEEEMADEVLNPCIKNAKQWKEWTEELMPKRFLVPGQKPSAAMEALQQFLDIIDPPETTSSTIEHVSSPRGETLFVEPAGESTSQRTSSKRRALEEGSSEPEPLPLPKRARTDTGEQLSDLDESRSSSPEDGKNILTRKRSFPDVLSSGQPPSKRARVCTRTEHLDLSPLHRLALNIPSDPSSSGSIPESPRLHPNQFPTNVLEHRPRGTSSSSDAVAMHSLAMCAFEQLPHPTLVSLFPKHPRWQEPDVQLFLASRQSRRNEVFSQAFRSPDKKFALPRDMRSQGNLKREIARLRERLSNPSSMSSSRLSGDAESISPSTRVRFSLDDPAPAFGVARDVMERRGGDKEEGDKPLVARPLPGSDLLHRSMSLSRPLVGWLGSVFDWL